MSSLSLHLNSPHLDDKSVRQGLEIAGRILQAESFAAGEAPFKALHSELYAIQSQIDRLEGEHLKAAWGQERGLVFAQPEPLRDFSRMSFGNRMLRLGHAELAMNYYSGLDVDPNHHLWAKVRLARIIATRLSGEFQLASAMLSETSSHREASQQLRKECYWQRLCLDLSQNGNPETLLAAVFHKKEFAGGSYRLEGILWALAISEKKWLTKLPKVVQGKKPDNSSKRALYAITKALRECYDYDRPLKFRLKKLCKELGRTSELFNVDKELLAWAAACRWFYRSRAIHLAALALKEYQGLSLKLSNGKNKDVLGLMADMQQSKSLKHLW